MRSNTSRYSDILLILLLLLVMAAGPLLSACSAGNPSGTVNPAATSESPAAENPGTSTSVTDITAGSRIPSDQPSGPLRIYCTPRTTLNPLQETSASFLAVSQLVYEGLFAVGSNGEARPVLAEPGSLNTAANGYSLTLRLAADRRFHDGSPVTAGDVAASFAVLQAAGSASAYNSLLPEVVGITAADDTTLTISLNKPQPDIGAQLTFPVIPAEALATNAADPLAVLPGTGAYRISSYTPAKGLRLQADTNNPAGRDAVAREIEVIELQDLHTALTAFERDGIDLAGLPAKIYPFYALRSGMKLERYATNQYVFISFRSDAGAPLADSNRLRFVKAASRDPRILADSEQLGLQTAAVPVHPDSSLWKSTAGNSREFIDLYQPGALAQTGKDGTGGTGGPAGDADPAGPAAYPATRTPLVILAQTEDKLLEELTVRLQAVLAEGGAATEVRLLPATEYETARTAGQYDILVAQAVTGNTADPRWLLGQNSEPGIPGSELLSRNGLAGYTAVSAAIDRLFAGGSEIAADSPDLLPLLTEAANLAPFTGIGFRYAALASGSRVLGQPAPQANKLYEGIEELWLWST